MLGVEPEFGAEELRELDGDEYAAEEEGHCISYGWDYDVGFLGEGERVDEFVDGERSGVDPGEG